MYANSHFEGTGPYWSMLNPENDEEENISSAEVLYTEYALYDICCPRYYIDNDVCTPVCKDPCQNGKCMKPDVCSCNTGFNYNKNYSYICDPVCAPSCVNGNCVDPNKCSCNDGYLKDSFQHHLCHPICSEPCTNGQCTSPEVCTCDKGYQKNSSQHHLCNPICSEPCTNGECTSPEVCTCDKGYQKDSSQHHLCNPICSEPCTNGECTSPEVCTCDKGYQKDSSQHHLCNPICSEPCTNGQCTYPEECTCNTGYRKDLSDKHKCLPTCSKPCTNGEGTSPEECTCNTGYRKDFSDKHKCLPTCSKPCTNGECTSPEECTCNTGYRKDFSDKHKCLPTCSKPCTNGECTSPEECTCNTGYRKDFSDKHKCLPTCSRPCTNGECTSPEECTCNTGYRMDFSDKHKCLPICSKPCTNGNCTSPEVCTCDNGYQKDLADQYKCSPFCSKECQNGECVLPDICKCRSGYENPTGTNSTCAPVCDGGCTNNSVCIAPNQCICKDGFKNSTLNTCSPICSKECINSNCTAPENCECFPGFKKDENEPNKCLPFCSNECLNGLCTDPEVCTCLWGFQSFGNSSNCTRSENSILSYSLKGKLTSSEGEVLSSLNLSEIGILNDNKFVNLLLTRNTPYFSNEESVITLNCSLNNPDSEIQNVEVVFECEIETVTRVTKTKTSNTTENYYQNNQRNSLELGKIKNQTSFELIIKALPYIEKEKIRNDYFDEDRTADVKHWCHRSSTTKGYASAGIFQLQLHVHPCVHSKMDDGKNYLAASVFVIFICIILLLLLLTIILKKRELKISQSEPSNLDFFLSLLDGLMQKNSLSKSTVRDRLILDPHWEFPREDLELGESLGKGEFGLVFKAVAKNIKDFEGNTVVAVKTPKSNTSHSEVEDLLSEYNLMKKVSHPNVVMLLGACTSPGPLYVIIEFAEHGCLQTYLRSSRKGSVKTGEPVVPPLSYQTLLDFACQICKGMSYLAEKQIVHRDLATRNVLLAADFICKVSDFGLSRDMYIDETYMMSKKGKVPVKWLALESLKDRVFSSKSDVWSYGVLLWELCTLGATPYPWAAGQDMLHLLREGTRLEQPSICTAMLYKLMRDCWLEDPNERPTFPQICDRLKHLVREDPLPPKLDNMFVKNGGYE